MTISYGNLAAQLASTVSIDAHPEHSFYKNIWSRIRDCDFGEDMVKSKTTNYLPRSDGQEDDDYASYLSRAVFYNMTGKTANALHGQLFKSAPRTNNIPEVTTKRFSKDGQSLNLSVKYAAKEVLLTGRFGMLVDSPAVNTGKNAYVATYTAENILDWESNSDGELTLLVLKETAYDRDTTNAITPHAFKHQYRKLTLEDGIYTVAVYKEFPSKQSIPTFEVTPNIRGKSLDHIPFTFVGPFNNQPAIQKPPLLDIVNLNLSHFKSYAELESGRFYTANPVYTTNSGGDDNEDAPEYYIAPNVVWELGKDGSADILEFSGKGLGSLENALVSKERQIESIGGRLIPALSGRGSRSQKELEVSEQSEQSLLLNLADTLDEAFLFVLEELANWNNHVSGDFTSPEFKMNRDYITQEITARDIRIIYQMYSDGALPIDVLYDYLDKADIISDWMSLKKFKKLLKSSSSFPNAPEAIAHMNQFPDAKSYAEYLKAANENTK